MYKHTYRRASMHSYIHKADACSEEEDEKEDNEVANDGAGLEDDVRDR